MDQMWSVHEYQDYHMDLKDHFAVTFGFIGKIIHRGRLANVFAMKKNENGFYPEGQYLEGTF